jgi:hypothetical protein
MVTGWEALSEFLSHNRIPRDGDGRCRFRAYVSVTAKESFIQETEVLISTHNGDGNPLRITPSGKIKTDHVHTEFNPRYQKFTFSGGATLMIEGQSNKMGVFTVAVELAG